MFGMPHTPATNFMKKKQGFTLIELIVVLVIIGIVAGITVPRYTGSFHSLNFRKVMSDLVFFLREARICAMSDAKATRVVFDLQRGFCWNDSNKKMCKIPYEVVMFTDKIESRDDKEKSFTFYPNGTALDERLGFLCDKMMAVLHVEPLGGASYFKMNENMEQVVLYTRSQEPISDEEIQKFIDKSKDSDTVKDGVSIDEDSLGSYFLEDDEEEDEDEYYDDEDGEGDDDDDEGMDDE